MKTHYEDDELSIREGSLALDTSAPALAQVESLNWQNVAADLHQSGNALLKAIFSRKHCDALASLYGNDEYFRSRVIMSRHGFGRGEYKYFKYPLPDVLQELRTTLYEKLAPIANDWNEQMGMGVRYPTRHADQTLSPMQCTDPQGFDRADFHRRFNVQVLDFFRKYLP